MKSAKFLYIAVFCLTALTFGLFEAEVLPLALIPDAPDTTYGIDLASMLTAIGGCFLLLACFRIPFLRKLVEQEDAAEADRCHALINKARLVTWCALILINIILYYEAPFANNPKYSILILFVAGIFCWPQERRILSILLVLPLLNACTGARLTPSSPTASHTYTLFSDGMPAGAVVAIHGQEFRGLNAQGGQSITAPTLRVEDITVTAVEGYQAKVSIDEANHQVTINFIQSSVLTADSSAGTMPCATVLYALPGAEFTHKLVPHPGETVTGVDFGGITTLRLCDDRLTTGNRYRYVAGTAPTEEGEYAYTVMLAAADGTPSQVKVRLTVSRYLQSPTPMMGWLTWNWFARAISHDKMVEIAKGMQRHGLIEAGFSTIVLDDAWALPTHDKNALTYDPEKFPKGISGLKAALKGINDRLKVGIYSDAGSMTCENYQPGSFQHEAQHVALFDSWGVDMLKYDYCNSEANTWTSYSQMGEAVARLNATRKANGQEPFVFNICEWGKTQPWLWGAEAGGSSWRATSDAREDWVGNNSRPGVLAGVDETRRLWMYAGVNRYNDLDMMCIGLHGLGGPSNNTMNHTVNGGQITGLTDAQARTQMSLWCMLASPLALTCDLRDQPQGEANSDQPLPSPLITAADIETLTNAEIIAINQDALGQQAEYMEHLSTGKDYADTGYDVYVKDLSGGRIAVAVTNRSSTPMASLSLRLTDLYLQSNRPYLCREVWTKQEATVRDTLNTGSIGACETKVYVLTAKP